MVVDELHWMFPSPYLPKSAMPSSTSRSLVVKTAFTLCAISASLCAVASAEANRSAQNSPRIASAALHLTAFVVPVLQAGPEAVPKQDDSSITFTLTSPVWNERYDVRTFLPAAAKRAGKQDSAVLRTLTIVPK